MTRLLTSGFEDTLAAEGWNSAGSPTRVNSPVYSGSWSVQMNAAEGIYKATGSAATDQNYYTRLYFRIATRPAAGNSRLISIVRSDGSEYWRLTYTTTGGLQARTAGGVAIGSPSASLSSDTWYVLETRTKQSSTNNDEVEARVYEAGISPDASFVNVTADRGWSASGGNAAGWVSIGSFDVASTIYIDDLAINNSAGTSDNSWSGPIYPPTGEPAYPNAGIYPATGLYPSATSGTSDAYENPVGTLLVAGSRSESYSTSGSISHTEHPVGTIRLLGSIQEEGPEPAVIEQRLFVQMAGHGQ